MPLAPSGRAYVNPIPDKQRCIDDSPHSFVHLRHETREISYRRFADIDTFYCSKCLTQKTTENEITHQTGPARW
jgi:hypothetical protein